MVMGLAHELDFEQVSVVAVVTKDADVVDELLRAVHLVQSEEAILTDQTHTICFCFSFSKFCFTQFSKRIWKEKRDKDKTRNDDSSKCFFLI